MKRALLVLVVLAACHPSDENDYPVTVGGGGFGGGQLAAPDAANGGDGGPSLVARVCLMTDPRDQGSCAATGAGGLTVTLGTSIATTADDGTFTIARPASTSLVWVITGTTIVPSVMSFAAQPQVPAIPATLYAQLQGDNGVVPQAGQGAAMVRVVHGTVLVPSATVTISPAGIYATLYDGATPSGWTQSATGSFGAAWMPGVTAGTANITVTPQGGTSVVISQVPIVDGGVTFLTQEVP